MFNNQILAGGAAAAGSGAFFDETISNSIRINANATGSSAGRLTKTFSTVDSASDFTLNFWIKRNLFGGQNPVNSGYTQHIFNFRDGTSGSALSDILFVANGSYGGGDQIAISDTNSGNIILRTTNVLRDPAGWYNIHIASDLNNSTNSEKLKIFINGVEASYTTDNRGSYTAYSGLKAGAWTIGDYYNYSYSIASTIARWAFVDNSVLAPTVFGELKNNIWIPKALTGITWGSAGHLLDFGASGTSADANGIGADTSGQGNHWAVTNIEAHDRLIDTPTSNFATFNTLDPCGTFTTVSEGGLRAVKDGAQFAQLYSTFTVSSGKWYAEFIMSDISNASMGVIAGGKAENPAANRYLGQDSFTYGLYGDGRKVNNGSYTSYGVAVTGATDNTADVVGVLIDADNGNISFSKNGTVMNSGTPAFSGVTGPFRFAINTEYSDYVHVNFGQDDTFGGQKTGSDSAPDGNGIGKFFDAPPSGYLALANANFDDPAIGANQTNQADDFFNTLLYTGNASSRSLTGVNLQPDWVWFKPRSDNDNNVVFDSVRGAQKFLYVNTTGVEGTRSGDGLSSFDSDGFSIGDWNNINENSQTYVAWNWKAGGSANTFNIDGTGHASASAAGLDGGNITPTGASINTTSGISIITYTGNGSANQTIKHGLSSPPEFIIIRDRDTNSNNNQWQIIHTHVGDDYGYFTTDAFTGTGQMIPTSGDATTVTIGRDATALTNESGDDFIMYSFHSVPQYQKFGVYHSNGTADGAYVDVGFRPAFLLLRLISSGQNWSMYDNKRDPFNFVDEYLIPNDSQAAGTTESVDFLSNGFKIRNGSAYIGSDADYLYWAIAEQDGKFANAR